MTAVPEYELDLVFGSESTGATPEERAASSSRIFIRSQHQISVAGPGATGRRFSAVEIQRDYGWSVLRELVEHSAAPVVTKGNEPLRRLKEHIRNLGLTEDEAIAKLHWSDSSRAAFKSDQQVPFAELERLAQSISIDAHTLGRKEDPEDAELGVRLRQMKANPGHFNANTVLVLAEASWVVRKQMELMKLLDKAPPPVTFNPSHDYGSFFAPAWRKGFDLAAETRDMLNLGWDQPIESMTQLVESLGIPVIHVELPPEFAGATVSSRESRGIVINTKGKNQNVWVRRMTMAHELGHVLWDPTSRLRRLVVDSYAELETDFRKTRDQVEQRANAFAVEFLVPRATIEQIFEQAISNTAAVETIMEQFGVARTAATFHSQNALSNRLNTGQIKLEPDYSLIAREELLVSYPALDMVPISRRGQFATLVAEAVQAGLISTDTAAAYLGCGRTEVTDVLGFLEQLEMSVAG